VRLYARIALLLGGYLLAGGLVYGGTNKERIGLVLLLVAGSGFAYVGLYARRAARVADRAARPAAGTEPAAGAAPAAGSEPGAPIAADSGPPGPEGPAGGPHLEGAPHLEEVRPTLWPLVFSLAGAAIVAGVLASHWILLGGGLLFVAASAGWFREVLSQRHGHG
jgi:hypothetical protein